MSRKAPTLDVVRRLFALSGNECAFPGCENKLITSKGNYIGQICHIEAANDGGERWSETQDDEERRSFENLLLLCYEHHIETNDVIEYPKERLYDIKCTHEKRFLNNHYSIPSEFEDSVLQNASELLNKIYALSLDTNKKVGQSLEIQAEVLSAVKNLVASSTFDVSKFYSEELGAIKQLREKGKTRAVLELLLDYKNRRWNDLSEELKVKVLLNLGQTYYELSERDLAEETLFQLKEIHGGNEEAIALISMAYATRKERESFQFWFENGIHVNRENINLWIAHIQFYKDSKTLEEILSEIPRSIQSNALILINLIQAGAQQGQFQKCFDFLDLLKEDVTITSRLANAKAILASRILMHISTPFKILYSHFSQKESLLLEQAISLLTEALAYISDTDLVKSRWVYIMNRGLAFKLAGQLNKAFSDLERAFEFSQSYLPFKNLVLIKIQLGQWKEAEDFINSYEHLYRTNERESYEIDSLKAKINHTLQRYDDAVIYLTKWLDCKTESIRFEVLGHLINYSFLAGNVEFAKQYAGVFLKDFPDKSLPYRLQGFLYYSSNNFFEAKHWYLKALDLMGDNPSFEEVYSLAYNFISINEFTLAARILEPICDPDILNDISKGLVKCYYELGNLQSALSLALPLFKRFPSNVFLGEVIANCYLETGRYQDGINNFDLLELPSDRYTRDSLLFTKALLFFQLRQFTDVVVVLRSIEDPLGFQVDKGFKMAKIFIQCGETYSGIDLAYQLRLKHFSNADVHVKYLHVVMEAGEDFLRTITPEVVTPDCAVFLLDSKSTVVGYIISRSHPQPNTNVLSPEEEFAKLLLGKQAGDFIIDKDNRSYGKIEEILNLYVFAYRESLKLFESRFRGETKIKLLDLNNAGEMKEFLRESSLARERFQRSCLQLYLNGQATVGSLAGTMQVNPVKAWMYVISVAKFSSFTHNEVAVVQRIYESKLKVVADLSCLLTNFMLFGRHILCNDLPCDVVISQSTIDVLNDFCDEIKNDQKKGKVVVAYQNDGFVGTDSRSLGIEEQYNLIQGILSWCLTKATVIVPGERIKLNRAERQKLDKIYHQCFHDTLLLAKELDAPVLSDDDFYKNVLQSEFKIASFSSYQLSAFLYREEKLSQVDYEDFCFELLKCNYQYIPVNETLLWAALEATGYAIKAPFDNAVAGLLIQGQPACVLLVVGFLKRLYLNVTIQEIRTQIVVFLVQTLKRRTDFTETLSLIVVGATVEFRLLQDQYQDLLQIFRDVNPVL